MSRYTLTRGKDGARWVGRRGRAVAVITSFHEAGTVDGRGGNTLSDGKRGKWRREVRGCVNGKKPAYVVRGERE